MARRELRINDPELRRIGRERAIISNDYPDERCVVNLRVIFHPEVEEVDELDFVTAAAEALQRDRWEVDYVEFEGQAVLKPRDRGLTRSG